MSNKQNTEYDGIKKMLKTLRNLNESYSSKYKTINEQEEPQNQQDTKQEGVDYEVINHVEVKTHSADEADLKISENEKNALSQLIDNFRSQVSEIADFKEGFNIYVDTVRLDGSIPDIDMSFVFIAGENRGIYINADMLELTPENILIVDKLEKFFHIYEDVANNMIRTRKTN